MTFSIFSCFLHIQPAAFQPPDKAVILSEALRRSIANRGLYGAESKDPGDACWQMLLGAFRRQTTLEDKKVTNSERSGVEGPAVFCPTPILSSVTFSLRHSTSHFDLPCGCVAAFEITRGPLGEGTYRKYDFQGSSRTWSGALALSAQ